MGTKCGWAQICTDTNVYGHKRVWTQMCVAQTGLGTNMSGRKRAWEQTCGLQLRRKKLR